MLCVSPACPVMDTNIRRVLGRLLVGHSDIDAETGWALAEAVVPKDGGRASSWHQALMDLGATVCSARRPRCDECPVNELCAARPLFSGDDSPTIRYAELPETLTTLSVAERPRSTQQGWIGTTRYYRGRIVEALRNHADGAMALGELGPLVRDDYTPTEHGDWLRGLLGGLERDGLVVVGGGGGVAGVRGGIGMKRDASFSEDRKYRYVLDREWDESGKLVTFIMLNPSNADEVVDDRTIKRCITFAKEWGYGRLRVVNLLLG